MSKVTITNGMDRNSLIEDFNKKKESFHFSSKELIELKTNLDIFIEEYREHVDLEYLCFLETLQAKMLGYVWRAKQFEENEKRSKQ